jgi:hypothetical protein
MIFSQTGLRVLRPRFRLFFFGFSLDFSLIETILAFTLLYFFLSGRLFLHLFANF